MDDISTEELFLMNLKWARNKVLRLKSELLKAESSLSVYEQSDLYSKIKADQLELLNEKA